VLPPSVDHRSETRRPLFRQACTYLLYTLYTHADDSDTFASERDDKKSKTKKGSEKENPSPAKTIDPF
jgi:hypothetical protein